MKSLRSALTFIGIAGFAFSLLMVALIWTSNHEESPMLDTFLVVLPAWSFIGTGLFAWWRRPTNRCGALMTAVGFAWLLIPLGLADAPGVFIVGVILANLAWLLLAQLLLIFPSGDYEASWHRKLVYFLYFDAIVLQAMAMLFVGRKIPEEHCDNCPDNPIAIATNRGLAEAFDAASSLLAVVLLIVLITILVRRYRSLGTASRAAIRPVLFVGGYTVLSLGLLVFAQFLGASETVGQVMFLFTVAGFALIPFAFLFGLLRSRFSSAGAVSELISTFGDSKAQELDIRDALAEALGDPSLQFVYWLPDREIYVDQSGQPIDPPSKESARGWTPVEHDGDLIASIVYDKSLADNQQLIRAIGSAAALALRNQRLDAELRANVEELRASRARIVQASDAARRELERNLHDGAQQHLVSMALTIRMAQNKIESDPDGASELLTQASNDLAEATTELRELARGIHPAILTDRGLAAALDALASRSAVPVQLSDVPEIRLPQPVESAAYFVVAEALTNVARYAEASKASVSVERSNGVAVVKVTDDGVGGAEIGAGTGLRGLQDRVAALDGKLTIESPRGDGTTVRAEFPCAS